MRVPRAASQAHKPRPATAAATVTKPAPGTKPASAAKPASATRATPVTRATRSAARQGRAPRAPFVLLVVGLLCGGLVSLLLLNVVLSKDSFRLNELRKENNELSLRKEQQKNENMQKEMPDALARNARNQGQEPDWDTANVLSDNSTDSRAVNDGQTPAGQERVPGTGR
ncbi:hypothetical protein [Streptosporangium sp. NPDC000396]|uniref:hypothetical protein n=1 Tax=Streptosporangium sp. NPDC000396 TaxID=3366185 RepID=UPI0036C9B3FC